ncbi:efflux RND transporter permease subunit [Streptomyces sp. KL116D]|uniref:efflux RND transporter permease subunit n=1 Tax=Streptomyces sp. KL116D TaxID=3045152 RepID=UPI00355718D3
MSWLSRFSLAQRALIGLMSIIAIAFGAIAIPQLKQQLLPTIELPMVSVLAPYQGRPRTVVEKQVVEPLENSIDAVDGITGITSTASRGQRRAPRPVRPRQRQRLKQLVADVQQAVQPGQGPAPPTTSTRRSSPGRPTTIPTVVLAVTSDKDQQALADQLDKTVVPSLKDIDGVGQVTVDGVRDLRSTSRPTTGRWPRRASACRR